MGLGLFPMPLGLAMPAPLLPDPSQLQQGAGRGKERKHKLTGSIQCLGATWGRGRGSGQGPGSVGVGWGAFRLPPPYSWGCIPMQGLPRLWPLSPLPCVGLGGWVCRGTASVSFPVEQLPVPGEADAETSHGGWAALQGCLLRLWGGEGPAAPWQTWRAVGMCCLSVPLPSTTVTWLPGTSALLGHTHFALSPSIGLLMLWEFLGTVWPLSCHSCHSLCPPPGYSHSSCSTTFISTRAQPAPPSRRSSASCALLCSQPAVSLPLLLQPQQGCVSPLVSVSPAAQALLLPSRDPMQ